MPKPKQIDACAFLVDFTWNGKRYKRVFRFPRWPWPKDAAQNYIESVLETGGEPKVLPMTFREAAKEYMGWVSVVKKKKQSTWIEDNKLLYSIEMWYRARFEGRAPMVHYLKAEDVRNFRLHFIDEETWYKDGKSRPRRHEFHTWEQYRLIGSAMWRWYLSRKYVTENPWA
ncbi:hypothetical protein GF356_10630, partial [candidate division GN15 bacterium]|nr:hypothetical protein [candidate division GN15 bacterium]